MERIEYLQTNKFAFPNAVVNVHFPDLTEGTRKQRMKAVHKTAEELLKSKQKQEGKQWEQWQQAYKLH